MEWEAWVFCILLYIPDLSQPQHSYLENRICWTMEHGVLADSDEDPGGLSNRGLVWEVSTMGSRQSCVRGPGNSGQGLTRHAGSGSILVERRGSGVVKGRLAPTHYKAFLPPSSLGLLPFRAIAGEWSPSGMVNTALCHILALESLV